MDGKLKVIISGVPKKCSLKLIKKEILNVLNGDKFAVTNVKRCEDSNDKNDKLEVDLSCAECKKFYQLV